MKTLFPNIGVQNLKTQVYEIILNLIIEGKLKVGDILPPERELAEELGVSRTVIREAIKSLETRGVLKVTHGKGIEVSPITSHDISYAFMLYLRRQKQKMPLKELLDLRCVLEPEITKIAVQEAKEEDIHRLEKIIQDMSNSKNNIEEFDQCDLDFHLQITYMAKNIFFETIMEALIIPIRKNIMQISQTGKIDYERAYREHYDIFQSIKERNPEKAKQAMEKSLLYPISIIEEYDKS
jgi:GntR family transcriptional repressor for pyruvate dehydrogenase complex